MHSTVNQINKPFTLTAFSSKPSVSAVLTPSFQSAREMAEEIQPKAAPSLDLPKSNSTCEVSIIPCAPDLVCATDSLLLPVIKGHERLNLPTYAFHITHKVSGKQVMFDAGARKDWWNMTPSNKAAVLDTVPGIKSDMEITEILTAGGVDLNNINSVIFSHWHWDHTGNMALFPKSTEVIVGQGFKEAFLPAYPEGQKSPFHAYEFEGREIREIEFNTGHKIGDFPAYDLFGDGSLYLLDAPGHAVGHVMALVRTTPDTFMVLGGDITHFSGAFRPTQYKPMPSSFDENTKFAAHVPSPCSCHVFTACHPDPENARTKPFYHASSAPGSWYVDPPLAQKSITSLYDLDANPNIMVAIAHDPSLGEVLPLFPSATINDWKEKGYKEKTTWRFLNELPIDGKQGRPPLVDGLYREGEKVRGLELDS